MRETTQESGVLEEEEEGAVLGYIEHGSEVLPLTTSSTVIGRNTRCAVVISDGTVSSRHCEIVFRCVPPPPPSPRLLPPQGAEPPSSET